MKKIVKLLPVALALLAAPAFAATATNGDSTQSTLMQFTITPYLDIKESSVDQTATITAIDDQYENFTIDNAFVATYKVYNNYKDRTLALTAKAGTLDTPALYATTGNKFGVVFANTSDGSGSIPAGVDDVKSIVDGTPTNSPNCFAIEFTPTCAKATEAPTGTANLTTGSIALGKVPYTLGNGIYDFSYESDTKAIANTFSTQDTHGIYKATLTLSDTTTP